MICTPIERPDYFHLTWAFWITGFWNIGLRRVASGLKNPQSEEDEGVCVFLLSPESLNFLFQKRTIQDFNHLRC